MKHRSSTVRGFSLLEMSIVLVIIGVVIATTTLLFNNYIKQSQFKETQHKLAVIQQALYDYRRAHDRLPCPADVTVGYNNPTYAMNGLHFGDEARPWFTTSGFGCYDADGAGYYKPSANIIDDVLYANWNGGDMSSGGGATTSTAEGMVPTRTLGLPDDYAIDGWGKRIMYAVDMNATAPSLTKRIPLPDTGTLRITIIPYGWVGGDEPKTTHALYALISFGPDGHGGWVRNAAGAETSPVAINTNSQNAYQHINCNCDPLNYDAGYSNQPSMPTHSEILRSAGSLPYFYYTTGEAGGFIGTFDYSLNAAVGGGSLASPAFVQGDAVQDPAVVSGVNDFDDIVVYATRADLPGYKE